jgi:putative transposase
MALRLVITDAVWAEMEPILRMLKHSAGSPPQLSDRLFIEAVLYQARTGIPWRDLPEDFGHWDAVYNRFRRWEARSLWKRLWQHVQQHGCALATQIFIDSTIIRAHQHAAGAPKKTVGNTPRLLAALGEDFPPSYTPPARTKRRVWP